MTTTNRMTYFLIGSDHENGSDDWWDGLRQDHYDLSRELEEDRGEGIVVSAAVLDKIKALPGYDDKEAADFAPHPILIEEFEFTAGFYSTRYETIFVSPSGRVFCVQSEDTDATPIEWGTDIDLSGFSSCDSLLTPDESIDYCRQVEKVSGETLLDA